MVLLMPSARILGEIEFGEDSPFLLTQLSKYNGTRFQAPYFGGYTEIVREYYKVFTLEDWPKFQEFCQLKLFADGEALSNADRHNISGSRFSHGLFLGEKGLCSSFSNDSNYFRDPEIKRQYESKELPRIHNAGTEIIYEGSDIIEVDADNGILYLVHFVPSE